MEAAADHGIGLESEGLCSARLHTAGYRCKTMAQAHRARATAGYKRILQGTNADRCTGPESERYCSAWVHTAGYGFRPCCALTLAMAS